MLARARLSGIRSALRGFAVHRLASTLAVVEHANGAPVPAALSALGAAKQLGSVSALIAGSDAKSVAESVAKLDGVEKVLVAASGTYDHGLPEPLAELVAANVKKGGFTHIVAGASAYGKNFLPRVGALLDVQPVTDVTKIESEDTFERPIYAGNAIATTKSNDPIKLVTVRASAFAPAADGSSAAPVEDAEDPAPAAASKWLSEEVVKSERPDLGSAARVVSGGRGLKDKENFDKVMFPLADALGAAVGASRAAVDSGFADNSLQVGQTGKVVAPELYVAVGISGAIQHLAGMKDSKTIVAINKDAEAPIFQVADVGLVADLFDAVPELTDKVKSA